MLRFKWFALEQGVRGKSCFGKARLSATETDIKHAKAIIKTRIVLMIELKSDRIDQYLNTKQAAWHWDAVSRKYKCPSLKRGAYWTKGANISFGHILFVSVSDSSKFIYHVVSRNVRVVRSQRKSHLSESVMTVPCT